MNLRPLRWWDIADLVPLERELFPGDAWSAETFWAELANDESRTYLVAGDENAAPAGYAGLSCPVRARGGDAEIMTVAVAPAARGAGIGRALVEALRETATSRGAGRLLLEVRADNTAARRLYAAAGFEPVATRPGYYRGDGDGAEPAVDALVLSMSLTGPSSAVGS